MLWRFVAALLAFVMLAGCTGPPRPDANSPKPLSYPNWPEGLADFRFSWSAEPGIDLLTDAAVPLRAFVESFRVGEYTADLDAPTPGFASYPGFLDAIPPRPSNKMEGRDIPYQAAYARPWPPTLYSQVPVYGTEYLHVLQLDNADAGYRAYVCDGRYNVFRKDATGKYISIASVGSITKYSIVKVWRVDLAAPAPADTSEPPQKGPNPAPLDNVFGGWKITGASDQGAWGMNDAEYRDFAATAKQLYGQCVNHMPHSVEQQYTIERSVWGSPPSPEPAAPGWPAQAS